MQSTGSLYIKQIEKYIYSHKNVLIILEKTSQITSDMVISVSI